MSCANRQRATTADSIFRRIAKPLALVLAFGFWAGIPATAYAQTIIKSVAAGSDDAEEAGPDATGSLSPGDMDLTSSDIELVTDNDTGGGYSGGTQKIGLRFTAMTIPSGAAITDAYLAFRAVSADPPMSNSDVTNLTIKGQLIANAPTFTSTNGNISGRTLTTAAAAWAPASWSTGTDYNSPSIASVIQEIVDQGTWASGNAIAIIITGTGHRASASYNGDSTNAAELVVTYSLTSCTVTTTADSGAGSLRQCINYANSNPGTTISFNIPGPGNQSSGGDSWWRISPASALPTITANGTRIDGTTQTTNQGNTNTRGPEIELSGGGAGAGADGLSVSGRNGTIRGLVINMFGQNGISLTTAGGSTVEGNYLGLDAIGTNGLGNVLAGISLQSNDNLVGGTSVAARNVLSGNFYGIDINGGTGNNVRGNYIGTDATGTIDVPNAGDGVIVRGTSPNNTIGGAVAGAGNLISGNDGGGINFGGANNGIVVQGNLIGTDKTGTLKLANASWGIHFASDGNTIGGTTALARNVISGNDGPGIRTSGGAENNVILGNYIGVDITGTVKLGNTGQGVFLPSGLNTVGGSAAGAANVISGNGNGVDIWNGAGNVVQGNFIGTDTTGLLDLGNTNYGVIIENTSVGNTIGGTGIGETNTIAFNGRDGILVIGASSDSNVFSGNSIYSNGEMGIDIFPDGVGTGSGANNNKAAPAITSVNMSGSDFTAVATVSSGDAVEFFRVNNAASPAVAADPSNSGEGYLYLGRCVDNGGNCSGPHIDTTVGDANAAAGTLEVTLKTTGLSAGDTVSGTASDATNGTSEFSANVIAVASLSCTVTTTADSGAGSLRQCINYANSNPGTTISFNIPGPGNQGSGGDSWWRISPASALPTITANGTIIDGTTQTTNQGNTNTRGPEIEIYGAGAGAGVRGFELSGGNCAVRGLVINSFRGDGIYLDTSGGHAIQGNFIGTDATGTTDLGNTFHGINISNVRNNTIGGPNSADRNVISGNNGDGILLWNSGVTGTTVQGNFIGTDATGTAPLGNSQDGINIASGASDNTIGGTGAGERNIISDNGNDGIELDFAGTSNNLIVGNYIGTDVNGSAAGLGNARYGVVLYDGANANTIGGAVANAGNVIAGSGTAGIAIDGNGGATTINNLIQGNKIGTNVAGTAGLPNGTGILLFNGAASTTIGGTVAAARNVISGNTEDGIYLVDAGTDNNVILGNYIGTNANGDGPIPNGDRGIQIESGADNNTVGGTTTGARNIISGNTNDGIVISDGASPGTGTTGNSVQGNYIGVEADGISPLGNGAHGVHITTVDGNSVGGTADGAGNVIAHNTWAGVIIQNSTASANPILRNSIHTNGGIGIDLGSDGVTANDGAKSAAQSNFDMDYPIFDTADLSGTTLTVSGYVGSAPGQSTFAGARVEIFEADNTPPSQDGEIIVGDGLSVPHGEGTTYLGFLTTDASGNFSGSIDVAGKGLLVGDSISGTATDGTNNTSEFGANQLVSSPDSCPVVTTTADSGPGSLRQCINYANSNPGTTISFNIATAPNQTSAPDSWWRISLVSTLPAIIANGTIIDGTTQTTNQGNTNALGPEIEIRGITTAFTNGLELTSANNTVKGLTINGFSGVLSAGIKIAGAAATGNTVTGNYLGTDYSGTAALANYNGVAIGTGAQSNTIGGTSIAERNIISGNATYGAEIKDSGTDLNVVKGNYIGTDPNGTAAVANGTGTIIWAGAANNTIGGNAADEGNVISGNAGQGMIIANAGSDDNVVQGNLIGTDKSGTGDLGNGGAGININQGAINNTIGGSGTLEGNTIAFNGGDGINMNSAGTDGNQVSGNSMFSNGGLGIDLDPGGLTANNGTKNVATPNDEMDYPVFDSAVLSGTTLTVSGYVGSAPGQSTFAGARVEVFEADNTPANQDGEIIVGDGLSVPHGEGTTYLGFLTTDASGNFSGPIDVTGKGLLVGENITGTAADGSNNTSEFGANMTVSGPDSISGTVFEDVNYGGGIGRDLTTAAADAPSFTVGRSGVTVELYNAGGNFVTGTATVAGGSYSFNVAAGTYTVRVVNSTVTSSRPGSTGSELAVQTYRIDGVAEAAGDGAKKVGGELPSNEDAAANSGAQTLASLQGTDLDADGIPEWTQSIVTVDASAGDVSGVDFGFNFDVVVNTNDSGQGSLRQFIVNSNLLN
jgi:hypothetical protein